MQFHCSETAFAQLENEVFLKIVNDLSHLKYLFYSNVETPKISYKFSLKSYLLILISTTTVPPPFLSLRKLLMRKNTSNMKAEALETWVFQRDGFMQIRAISYTII